MVWEFGLNCLVSWVTVVGFGMCCDVSFISCGLFL